VWQNLIPFQVLQKKFRLFKENDTTSPKFEGKSERLNEKQNASRDRESENIEKQEFLVR